MATVYLARDLKHDRLVALKVLDPDLGVVLGAERFLSEIRVTANLHHPNLLPLFDSGEANGSAARCHPEGAQRPKDRSPLDRSFAPFRVAAQFHISRPSTEPRD
jgi:serine/threonine protein kinase